VDESIRTMATPFSHQPLGFKRWITGLACALGCICGSGFTRGAPVITEVSPISGAPGTSVSLKGSGLTQILEVQFGMAPALFTTVSANQIFATVPLEAMTGPIAVIAAGGVSVTKNEFLVPPRITALTPDNGPVGATIVIEGANFQNASAVLFNGTNAASFGVSSPTQIHATVQTGASSGPVTVVTPAGVATSSEPFGVTTQAPFVNAFNPTHGRANDVITLTGVNFAAPLNVLFNGKPASRVTVTSSSQAQATVPNGASTGPLTVTNRFGSSTSEAVFLVSSAPLFDELLPFDPMGGAPGTPVTLYGANFTGATAVSFAGKASSKISVVADSQLHTEVPSGATNGPITVVTPGGTGSTPRNFLATMGPIITEVHPRIGQPNTYVNLYGINLSTTTSVKINGVNAPFGVPGVNQIMATIPPNATSGPLVVTTQYGSVVALDPFLVQTGKPIITSFRPEGGAAQATVIIEGLDLARPTAVKFNGTAAPFTGTADTQITATVPEGATTGPISVSTSAGTTVSSNSFFVAPRLTSFSPAAGVAGDTVRIKGANLTPLLAARFREAAAAVQSASTNEIVATVPDEATTGSINVITPAGIVAMTNSFTVAPTIRQFRPANGSAGTAVTIYGTGLSDVTAVAFAGKKAPAFAVMSSTQLVAQVPAQPASGPISVTTSWGTATSARSFIVGAAVDLQVTQTQSTNVLFDQEVLTYVVKLTNQGPSTATGVLLVDERPETVLPLSLAATQGQISTHANQVHLDVGSLASAGSVQLTLTVLTTDTGSITNAVSVTAKEPEVDPENNRVVVWATVLDNPAVLQVERVVGQTLTLSWPIAATNFVLQFTDKPASPSPWQAVGATPSVSGTQKVVTLPIQGGKRFFRLFRP
jgi:uncharacterized repeat protein (TIGR01451 family)